MAIREEDQEVLGGTSPSDEDIGSHWWGRNITVGRDGTRIWWLFLGFLCPRGVVGAISAVKTTYYTNPCYVAGMEYGARDYRERQSMRLMYR